MKARAIALALLAAAPAAAQQPAAPTAAIPALSATERAERVRVADAIMEEAGTASMLDKMLPAILEQTLPPLARANSGREAEIRTILTEELGAVFKVAAPAIIARSRDLYVERFTAAELTEILEFNRSPTGRKATRLLPEIQMEMFAFGRQAGEAAFATALPRIMDRMKAANINVPTAS